VITMLILVIALAFLAGMAVLSAGLLPAWRRERHRSRLLAERLIVEGHIECLTARTLQAMRQAARDRLRGERS
jgi:hypothetical protein